MSSVVSHRRRRRASVIRVDSSPGGVKDDVNMKAEEAAATENANAASFGAGVATNAARLCETVSRKQSVSQRPLSHFCRACGRLMLSSQRQPTRLEPCGHSVCGRCAETAASVDSACPVCRLAVADTRPDNALKLEVAHFSETAVPDSDGVKPLLTNNNVIQLAQPPPQKQQQQQQPKAFQPQAKPSLSSLTSLGVKNWHSQLDMIGARMRCLEASLEQLESELSALTVQLSAEAERERQLRRAEAEARDSLERQQEEIRRLVEQRTASSEAQAQVQIQAEAKRRAIQVALAAQHSVSIELSRLQTMCGGDMSSGCGVGGAGSSGILGL